MLVNSDFKELLKLFAEESVDFLIVGAHAVIYYAEPRYSKGIDVWVRPTPQNVGRVYSALRRFGAPLGGMTPADFTREDHVYQMGRPPNRIDIVMGVEGLTFAEAWPNRVSATYDGEPMNLISRIDLIRSKQATGRPQDLLDVQRLLDE